MYYLHFNINIQQSLSKLRLWHVKLDELSSCRKSIPIPQKLKLKRGLSQQFVLVPLSMH